MDIYNMSYLCWFRPVQYVMKEQFSTGLLYVELIKVTETLFNTSDYR